MHKSLEKFNSIKNKIIEIINEKQLKNNPKIIVVTKTFSMDTITPFLDSGHIHYGENKIQEAEIKWIEAKKKYKNLQLHMLGKLQTNKAKKALKLFDFIHSLDNAKLASKLDQYQKELNKQIKFFIQVNVGDESQKSGIHFKELANFYNYCSKKLSLNIIGLMCLPPIDSDSVEYFKLLKSEANKFNLHELSMGMSSDFEQAILKGSTYLRLGTIIMGKRNIT